MTCLAEVPGSQERPELYSSSGPSPHKEDSTKGMIDVPRTMHRRVVPLHKHPLQKGRNLLARPFRGRIVLA